MQCLTCYPNGQNWKLETSEEEPTQHHSAMQINLFRQDYFEREIITRIQTVFGICCMSMKGHCLLKYNPMG